MKRNIMYLIPLLVWVAVMGCCVPFGRQTEVTSADDVLEIRMAAHGGCAVSFIPEK